MHQNSGIRGPLVQAAKIGRDDEGVIRRDFTYCVVEANNGGEKRSLRRRRTRLRSGKILDPHNAFLVECQIYDRSGKGARIRLLENILAPPAIRLYEDSPERLIDAVVIWRKDREIGLRFADTGRAAKLTKIQLTCLRGHHYDARARRDSP